MPRSQRVYIGNIPLDADKRDLEKFFKGYGRLLDTVVIKGYGFVEFENPRDADEACEDLDGKEMDGGKVKVELARRDPRERSGYRRNGGGYRGRGSRNGYRGDQRVDRRGPPGPRTGNRILVENISSRTSWQDLKDYFRTAGEITYTNVDRSGDGIVEFQDRRGLEYALKYKDELELDGRKLYVREEDGHYRSRRKSRSRSRTNSRSKSRSSRSETRSRTKSRSKTASRSRSRSRNHDDSKRRYRNKGGRNRHSRSRSESNSRSRSHERYSKTMKKDYKRARSYSKSRSRS